MASRPTSTEGPSVAEAALQIPSLSSRARSSPVTQTSPLHREPNPCASTTYQCRRGVRVPSRTKFAALTLSLLLLAAGSARGAGPVVGWGGEALGEATPPSSVDGTLGTASAAAGPVVAWGHNADGETTIPPSVNGTAGTAWAISGGGWHGCAIQTGT